jgi:hypothetical protein
MYVEFNSKNGCNVVVVGKDGTSDGDCSDFLLTILLIHHPYIWTSDMQQEVKEI